MWRRPWNTLLLLLIGFRPATEVALLFWVLAEFGYVSQECCDGCRADALECLDEACFVWETSRKL